MDMLKKIARCESDRLANTNGKTIIFAALIIAAALLLSSMNDLGSSGYMLFIFIAVFIALFGEQNKKSD